MKKIIAALLLLFSVLSYADQPIEIIVPFSPGGATDMFARATEQYLTNETGKSFIVTNRPGADGRIGARYASQKPADGSSLVITGTAFMFSKVLYSNPGYEFTDFDLITPIVRIPMAIIVPYKSNVNNIQDFMKAAETKRLNCGVSNAGGQLAMKALMAHAPGNDLEIIPFKGNSDLLNALVSGTVDCAIDTMAAYKTSHISKRVKIIAIDGNKSYPELGSVSFISERVSPYDFGSWFGVGILKATPGRIKEELTGAILKMHADSSFRALMLAANLDIVHRQTTVDESNKFILIEYEKFESIRVRNKIPKVE